MSEGLPPTSNPSLREPNSIIPDGKDVWSLILKNGVLTPRREVDDYERVHVKWRGLEHLKSIRLACRPMNVALTKIDLSINDYFRSTSLKGVLHFKKCFPNTKSAFRIRKYKYGDFFGEIYLGTDLGITSLMADGTEIYPLDTSDGNKFNYDIGSFRGTPVIKSSFFKETLQMIIDNNGLPEGIGGFLYETCIFSQASPDGIDSLEIFINSNLEFDTVRAGNWNRDLSFTENPEEMARREQRRAQEREVDSDSDSSD